MQLAQRAPRFETSEVAIGAGLIAAVKMFMDVEGYAHHLEQLRIANERIPEAVAVPSMPADVFARWDQAQRDR
jgi:hypothetical protein